MGTENSYTKIMSISYSGLLPLFFRMHFWKISLLPLLCHFLPGGMNTITLILRFSWATMVSFQLLWQLNPLYHAITNHAFIESCSLWWVRYVHCMQLWFHTEFDKLYAVVMDKCALSYKIFHLKCQSCLFLWVACKGIKVALCTLQCFSILLWWQQHLYMVVWCISVSYLPCGICSFVLKP